MAREQETHQLKAQR